MSSGYQPVPNSYDPAQQGNFSSNRRRMIPFIVVGAVLVLVLFVGGILAIVFAAIRNSEPYKHAVAAAMSDARVVRKLGQPIQPGWLVTGSIRTSGSSGSADLEIPLRGSLNQATLYVQATKAAGLWQYRTLVVEVQGGLGRIDLLPSPER